MQIVGFEFVVFFGIFQKTVKLSDRERGCGNVRGLLGPGGLPAVRCNVLSVLRG